MIESKEDHVLRQAWNLLQLLPTNPQEAHEVIFLLKRLLETGAQYYDPPVVH